MCQTVSPSPFLWQVEEARRATRQEKAERAMAVREKMLHEFGMKVSSIREAVGITSIIQS